jgi:chlorite dismutase
MHNPFVPETLEGWSLLHLLYRIRWDTLRPVLEPDRDRMAADAVQALAVAGSGATVWVQMLGHKADLMVICFRRSFDELAQAQLAISRSALSDHLELSQSYVSIVELGMYEMTAKIHEQLGATMAAGTEEYERAFDAEM